MGNTSVTAQNGVATFTGLSMQKASIGYTMLATATSYASTVSSSFNITPSQTVNAVFTTQPSNVAAGATMATVVVTLEDNFNNVVTSDSSTAVALPVQSSTGAMLMGTV